MSSITDADDRLVIYNQFLVLQIPQKIFSFFSLFLCFFFFNVTLRGTAAIGWRLLCYEHFKYY